MAKKKQATDGADEAPAAKDKRKTIAIAVAVLVVGYLGYTKVLAKPTPPAAAAPAAAAAAPPPEEGAIVEVGQMTVNLSGEALHYARVNFSVVLAATAVEEEVTARFPLLKDAALTEIGAFDPLALRSPDGVAQLRDRLTQRALELWPPAPDGTSPVLRVVLTELVVQ